MGYILINTIMFVRLAHGLYSKTSNNKLFTAISKVYCTILVIMVICFNIQLEPKLSVGAAIHLYNFIILYACMYMTSLLSNGENFYQYVSGLDNLSDIGQEKGTLSFLIFVLILFFNLIQFFVLYEGYNVIYLLSFSIISTATMLSHMTRIMIFNLLWSRMKALRMRTEGCLFFTEGFDEEQNQVGARALEENLIIYKGFIDNLKNSGNASKLLIVLSFPSYFICASQFVVGFENETRKQFEKVVFVLYVIESLINLVLPLVPAIFCELVKAEVDKIKLQLIKTTYLVQNEMLSSKISAGLKFLEVTPYRYSVWRFFHLDISMTVSLVSLCTTYVIAFLQFKKMYTS